jgi:hypothetical protein
MRSAPCLVCLFGDALLGSPPPVSLRHEPTHTHAAHTHTHTVTLTDTLKRTHIAQEQEQEPSKRKRRCALQRRKQCAVLIQAVSRIPASGIPASHIATAPTHAGPTFCSLQRRDAPHRGLQTTGFRTPLTERPWQEPAPDCGGHSTRTDSADSRPTHLHSRRPLSAIAYENCRRPLSAGSLTPQQHRSLKILPYAGRAYLVVRVRVQRSAMRRPCVMRLAATTPGMPIQTSRMQSVLTSRMQIGSSQPTCPHARRSQ